MAYKLLIIDDEADIIEVIKRRLIFEDNLEVEGVTNPLLALEKIKKEKIDIVLLDIAMPELDGITTLKKIKEIDGLVQVIIMTGYSTTDKAIECLRLGANDYILKPFEDMDNIVNLVNITIEKINRWRKIIMKSVKSVKPSN